MWFMFGLITLVSFSVYFGIRRFQARWRGTQLVIDGLPFEYRFVHRNKSTKIRQVMVGIQAPKEFDFSFKRESGLDRVFKWLGISVERQFGEEDFDKLVYVVSNDQHLLDKVMDDTELLGRITQLFKISHINYKVSHIHCRNGRLWVVFSIEGLFSGDSDVARLKNIFPSVVESLHAVAEHLAKSLPLSAAARRDPFVLRAMLVLAVSTGLAVNGLVHGYRQMIFSGPFTLDMTELWAYSVFSGIGILAALIVLAIFLLGRTARAHLVLIELLFVGFLGAILTSVTEIRDVNMDLDVSPVQMFPTKVIGKTISKSRKSGTRYYLEVVDWTKQKSTRRVQVSSEFYRLSETGENVKVRQRSGYLGIRWVEGVSREDYRWGS